MTAHERSPVISLKGVGVSYNRSKNFLRKDLYWALKDITFDLHKGETLGVLGKNGAGKSTLLRLLAGILLPDRGEVLRENCSASLLSLQVGFNPHLSGRENAIMSGLLLGVRRKDMEAKIGEIEEFAGLGDFFEQPVGTYSSGMRARLGFAAAFQANPDILLLDEVLGVGDAEFKEKSTAAMREIIRSDKTVIIVSHSTKTICELCDRAIWIKDGKTFLEGSVDEVIARYENDFSRKSK